MPSAFPKALAQGLETFFWHQSWKGSVFGADSVPVGRTRVPKGEGDTSMIVEAIPLPGDRFQIAVPPASRPGQRMIVTAIGLIAALGKMHVGRTRMIVLCVAWARMAGNYGR